MWFAKRQSSPLPNALRPPTPLAMTAPRYYSIIITSISKQDKKYIQQQPLKTTLHIAWLYLRSCRQEANSRYILKCRQKANKARQSRSIYILNSLTLRNVITWRRRTEDRSVAALCNFDSANGSKIPGLLVRMWLGLRWRRGPRLFKTVGLIHGIWLNRRVN